MSAGQISEQRARRARIGAAACFLFTGVIRELGLARTGHQGRPGLERRAVRDRSPRLGRGRRYRSPARRSRGTPHREPSSLDCLVARVLGYAVRPGGRSQPARAGRKSFLFAALNSVVDVAMNAQGVAVQRLMGRPVLSGMHAMHSLGGVLGAGAGALAARLGATPPPHFLVCAVAAVVVGLGACLCCCLTGRCKGGTVGRRSSSREGLRQWFSGWSVSIALLGALAFCFTLAEGAGLNWSAVYVTDSLGGTEALGAIGLGVFLGAVTLGRLVGDRLVSRLGPVRVFRAGPSWPA